MLSFFKEAGVTLSLDADRLKVEGLKQLSPEQAQEIRQKIQKSRGKIISELQIPDPSPASLGAEYDRLWNEAWLLAEFVDGDTAPYADRKARLPELLMMRQRMAEIEKAGAQIPAGLDPEPLTAGAWIKWESNTTTTRDRTPDTGMIKHPAIVREQ